MSATAIRTAAGWRPLWVMPAVTRATLQPNHQGWWMKDAAARRAFEDEQVNALSRIPDIQIKGAA